MGNPQMEPKIETVAVTEIDVSDGGWDEYLTRRRLEPGGLGESVATHGVIEPVTLLRHGERFRVICGFRRAEAARRAKVERIPAVVHGEGAIGPRDAFLMAIASNAPGLSYTDADRAVALAKAGETFGFGEDELIDTVAPQLGLPPSHKVVRLYLEIARMPTAVLDALSQGEVSRQHCEALALLPGDERQWFFENVLRPLRLSAGDARFVNEAAIDLAGRGNVSPREAFEPVLAESTVAESPGKSKSALKENLARRLSPIITEMEDEFAALAAELGGAGAAVGHSPGFEADEIRIVLTARRIEEIQAFKDALEKGLETGVFERMLSIARRKGERLLESRNGDGTRE
jgi:ParB-like chromosome segregation protein Spo0J